MQTADISQRIGEFVQYTKMSVRKFAIECGLSQPTLDKHVRGAAQPNIVTLIGIANRFPDLSLEWLLLGKGEMIKQDIEKDRSNEIETRNTERLLRLVDTIATLQETINIKTETINALTNQINQLKLQLNKL